MDSNVVFGQILVRQLATAAIPVQVRDSVSTVSVLARSMSRECLGDCGERADQQQNQHQHSEPLR